MLDCTKKMKAETINLIDSVLNEMEYSQQFAFGYNFLPLTSNERLSSVAGENMLLLSTENVLKKQYFIFFVFLSHKQIHIIINKRTFSHNSLLVKIPFITKCFRCKARQVIASSGDLSDVFNALFIKTSIHFALV